ncbi:Ca2+-dependent phosphoinositide-specific phospholipase C [Mariniflexile litorale]|uniref:Ca2+-dependent phosphoinositide-specific phospholipase C n=1 Tax=Mariniflexile litorale TaxID=3045158 RepID=A0AAU7EGC2_9FLAO|nr:Ca2+-dependent phosphoinositide-specific phospholipase C [Mariniflexile sp. KMM 9835]MDQ8210879.1 Ca2+-dependent phosphoinositide-specific phospholipase C [Mariniflexile sp. KMM 9835]
MTAIFIIKSNDYTRFEKAKASSAQVISTDYYIPTKLYKYSFKVSFKGNNYEKIKK